jgi:heme-degrading monooxygenase HmoA
MTCLRIWRTRVDLSRLSEYERFISEQSQPMFTAQPGFIGVVFSRSGEQVAVLSIWEDEEAVRALATSESYQQAVRSIAAAGFISADTSLEVLEVQVASFTSQTF